MSCRHTKTVREWVEDEDWYTGMVTSRWVYEETSTCEDIDLHRYKCTKCGEVMYYSGAAKEYYETGIDRKGLFN